jgi:hypothetical protein
MLGALVSDKHKDKDKDRDQPRTGSVTTADADLTTWLHSFWARDEFPEAIEVWQTFGRNKQDRGKQIHHVTFRANDRLDQAESDRHVSTSCSLGRTPRPASGRRTGL